MIPRKVAYALAALIFTLWFFYFTNTILEIKQEPNTPTNLYTNEDDNNNNKKININININPNTKPNINDTIIIDINADSININNNFNNNNYNKTEYYSPTKIYVPEHRRKFAEMYKEYTKFHTQTLEQEKKGGTKTKYIYITFDQEPTVGFGNKFPAYVTGLVMAILMKRIVLCNYLGKEKLSDLIDPGFEFEKPDWLKFDKRTQKKVTLSDVDGMIALNENFTNYFQEYDVVELFTVDYPLVLFYGNPNYKKWLMDNFGINPYSIIAPHLLRPTPKLKSVIDEFKSTYLSQHTIGIQIRTEKLSVKGGTALFTNLAKWLKATRFPSNARFFLAADKKSVRAQAKALLGDALVMVEPYKERYTPESEFYALVDIHLLASCDVIVMSYKSSFGAISMSLEGTETYMVYPDTTFAKLSIREPCYFGMRRIYEILEMIKDTRFSNNPFFLAQLKCHN